MRIYRLRVSGKAKHVFRWIELMAKTVPYSALDSLAERLEIPSPYRNPDQTFTSLIMSMGKYYKDNSN